MKLKKIFCMVFAVILLLCPLSVGAAAALYKSGTVGTALSWSFEREGISSEPWVSSGLLPAGVELAGAEGGFTIKGTPTESGAFYITVSYMLGTKGTSEDIYIKIEEGAVEPTAPPAGTYPPEIVKHPLEEWVYEGDGCMFTSYAENGESVEWYFVKGSECILAKEAYKSFSGLRVTDPDTMEIILENIPMSMNGWKIYAVFYGPGGSTESKRADIYVMKPTPKPTPTPTPTPAPAPVPSPAAVPEAPAAEESTASEASKGEGISVTGDVVVVLTPEPAESTSFEVSGSSASEAGVITKADTVIEARSGGSTMVIFIGAVVIVAMICGTVLYIILSRSKDSDDSDFYDD